MQITGETGKGERENEAAHKLIAKLKDPQINEHYEEYRQDKEENLKGLEEENEATKNNVSQPQDLIWETERQVVGQQALEEAPELLSFPPRTLAIP